MKPRNTGTVDVAPEITGRLKRATMSAVVTRADGRVEDLGVIAEFTRPSLFRLFLSKIGVPQWPKS